MPYFVLDAQNCLFESMTKEQIVQAIADAAGVTPESIDINAAFITQIKEQNANTNLKFWLGTQAQYNALGSIDPNTLYIFTDGNELELVEQIASDAAAAQVGDLAEEVTAINDRTAIETTAECFAKSLNGVDNFFATGSFIRFYLAAGVVHVYAGLIMPSSASAIARLEDPALIRLFPDDSFPQKYRPQNRIQYQLGNADSTNSSQDFFGSCSFRVDANGDAGFGNIKNISPNTDLADMYGKIFFYQFSYLPKALTE